MRKTSYLNLFFFLSYCFLYAEYGFIIPDSEAAKIYHKFPRDNSKRKSSYPFISGDTFRSICDHIIDETKIPFSPDKVKDGDIIFVNTHALEYFFCVCHPLIKSRYILT